MPSNTDFTVENTQYTAPHSSQLSKHTSCSLFEFVYKNNRNIAVLS